MEILLKQIAFFLFFFFSSFLWGHAGDPVILAGAEENYPPYSMIDPQGKPVGFSIELLNAALNVMDHQVRYQVGEWEQVKKALEKGEIQVLPLVGRTPEREEQFDFTFPYLKMHGTILYRKGGIVPASYEDLKDLRVGVMKGDNAEEFLFNLSVPVEIVSSSSFRESLELLSEGTLDAVVIQRVLGLELIKELQLDNVEPVPTFLEDYNQSFCFAVKKGDAELLKILNEGLATVISNGTFQRLQERWFYLDGTQRRADSVIIVGGDQQYPPYEYLNEKGEPEGFNVDLTRAIAREMGLNVEIRLGPWNEIYNGLYSGEIDIIEGLFYSPERAERISFSQAHSVVHHVAVQRKKSVNIDSIDDLANLDLLVMKGDIMDEWVQEQDLGRSVVRYDSQEDALFALEEGVGDCVLAAQIPSLYYIRLHNLNDLEISSLSLIAPEYNYGSLDENSQLIYQFSQGLSTLRESGEYREIYSKWLGVYQKHSMTREEKIRLFLYIALPVFFLLLMSALWVYSLKKQVALRTEEIGKAAKKLADQESILSYILEEVLSGYWDWDYSHQKGFLSPAFRLLLGYSKDEWEDKPEFWQSLIAEEDSKRFHRNLVDHFQSGGTVPFNNEVRYRHKDGTFRWILNTGKVIAWNDDGRPSRMLGCFLDLNRVKEAEENSLLLQEAIEQMDEALFITDSRGLIQYTNPAYEKLTGYERAELFGERPQILDEAPEDLWEVLSNGKSWTSEFEKRRKNGTLYKVHSLITPVKDQEERIVNFIAIFRDITKEKEMELYLQQAEKMEALGYLAGGIAHDFNNILGAILGFTELALMEGNLSGSQQNFLEMIQKSSERARDLVKQILVFSRQNLPKLEPVSLKEVIEEVMVLLQASFSSLQIQTELSNDCLPVLANSIQIHEVLLNLCTNAAHSMDNKGKLLLKLYSCSKENSFVGITGKSPAGSYTCVSVEDQGEGIAPDVIEHIFDPFFTTKEVGKGTGMGLSVVYSIIQEISGNIQIETEKEKGTIFTILIPSLSDRSPKEGKEKRDLPKGKGESILVVDDEILLCNIMENLLKSLGYQVRTETHPEKVLTLLEEESFDLLISDMTMPEWNGLELAEKVHRFVPQLPIILCSGYSTQLDQGKFRDYGIVDFCPKPVHLHEISRAVKDALHGK